MKRKLKTLSIAIGLSISMPLFAFADIVILHTNDTHCGIARNLGFARVAEYKKEMAKDHAVILADAGDAIQGEPVGKLTRGASIINILNAVGYDFLIPGNHEFDYGMENFLSLAPKAYAGYYSANFIDTKTGERIFPAYKIFTLDGKQVALIGVTTPQTLVSANPAFFKDESGDWAYGFEEDETGEKLYRCIQSVVDDVRAKGADYVLLVGHLGTNGSISVWSSPEIIAHTSGIDAVIDGHSHEQYSKVLTNKKGEPVILSQTGTKLETLGKITISDDGEISSELVTDLTAEDSSVAKIVQEENEKVEKELNVKVGVSTVDFATDIDGERRVRSGETNLGDLCADAIREKFHCDVAIVNGGSIRDALPAGELTYKDLMTVYPFGNMMAMREVSGQQLLDALEVGASFYPEENGGFLQVSGLTYTIDASIPSSVHFDEKGKFTGVTGERRVKDVLVDGEPLDPTGDYRVAGNGYILKDGGNGMTMFEDSYLLSDADVSDLETLVDFITARGGEIGEGYENPEGEGRIQIAKK